MAARFKLQGGIPREPSGQLKRRALISTISLSNVYKCSIVVRTSKHIYLLHSVLKYLLTHTIVDAIEYLMVVFQSHSDELARI